MEGRAATTEELLPLPHIFLSTMLPLEGEIPTGYRQSKEVAERLIAKAARGADAGGYAVPSCVLQFGDIGMSEDARAALPDDDAVVILLRSCVAVGRYPLGDDCPWAVSIVSVDQGARLVASLALDPPDADFVAAPELLKGDLLLWSTFAKWLFSALRERQVATTPCSLADWKSALAVHAAAVAGGGTAAGGDAARNSSDTAVLRLTMLLPQIEASTLVITPGPAIDIAFLVGSGVIVCALQEEFHAEHANLIAGRDKGNKRSIAVDAAWARRLARALAAERPATAASAAEPLAVPIAVAIQAVESSNSIVSMASSSSIASMASSLVNNNRGSSSSSSSSDEEGAAADEVSVTKSKKKAAGDGAPLQTDDVLTVI